MENIISPEYKAQITAYTKTRPWGGAVVGKVPEIHMIMQLTGSKSILDYGSGKSDYLNQMNAYNMELPYTIHEYEPAREEKAGDPPVSDFTLCFDVLEHVEPSKIDITLAHIASKTRNFAYITICLVPAHGSFPDGTNLHLSVHPADWWLKKLEADWEILKNHTDPKMLTLILKRKV